jgi:hypothetical protein
MAQWNLRRFTDPAVLATIRPRLLRRFLAPYRDYLDARGVPWPPGPDDAFDPDALLAAFADPGDAMPPDLMNALFLVDEAATHATADGLRDAARARGLPLDPDPDETPADLAVQVWLLDRDLLERRHAEAYAHRVRTFTSFTATRARPPALRPDYARHVPALEAALDDWFEGRQRGRGCRLFALPRPDAVWLVLRHAEPFRREAAVADRRLASVGYRPLKYDVLVYDPATGELRVNADGDPAKRLYRDLVGEHLFGDPDAFAGAAKYTLDPLRDLGADALDPDPAAGVRSVRLAEVQLRHPGHPPLTEVLRSTDLFAVWAARGAGFPAAGVLAEATFEVGFGDARRPRRVAVRPPNVARYARDADSEPFEGWLARRGFVARRLDEPGEPGR